MSRAFHTALLGAIGLLTLTAGCKSSRQVVGNTTCRRLTVEPDYWLDPSVLVQRVPPDSNLVEFVYQAEDLGLSSGWPESERKRFDAAQRAWLSERLGVFDSLRSSADLWMFRNVSAAQQGTTGILALRGCEVVRILDLVAVG